MGHGPGVVQLGSLAKRVVARIGQSLLRHDVYRADVLTDQCFHTVAGSPMDYLSLGHAGASFAPPRIEIAVAV